jgi:hypothetical protein
MFRRYLHDIQGICIKILQLRLQIEVGGQLQTPAGLSPGKGTVTHSIGGWEGQGRSEKLLKMSPQRDTIRRMPKP